MTRRQQLARLSVLRFPPADIEEHLAALTDLSDVVLEAAVSYALRTRTHFPVPVELRADADVVAVHPVAVADDRGVALEQPFTITVPEVGTVVSVTREWKYYDERCSDTGWASWWCGSDTPVKPWHQIAHCGRHFAHAPHEWVGRCACWDSNPALVRKREAQRKYAADPARASR